MKTVGVHTVVISTVVLFFVLLITCCADVEAIGVIIPPVSAQSAVPDAPVYINVTGCSGALAVHRPPNPTSQPITITAFFPLPVLSDSLLPPLNNARTPTDLHYLLPAAVIAVEEMNQAMVDTGYHLQLDVRNTQCDPIVAIKELTFLINAANDTTGAENRSLAVLGPGCMDVTTAVSPLAQRLYLPQVSYANDTNVPVIASEENLRDYPNLYFMVRDVYHVTKTALRVMDYFGWTKQVGFVYDDELIYTKTIELLVEVNNNDFIFNGGTENSQITVSRDVLMRLSANDRVDNIVNFMSSIRRNNIRVIAGLVGEETACTLLCVATNGTIPGDGFVFVFVGAYQGDWWLNEASCPCQLNPSVVESVIIISSQIKNTLTDDALVLGKELVELKQDYIQRLNDWCPETNGTEPNTFFATTYDAMLTLGLAINNSLTTINTSIYNTMRQNSVYQSILNSLGNTSFNGASGHVSFSAIGERMGIDVVQQIQDGVLKLVGTFDSELEELDINDSNVLWPGDGEVPGLYPEDDQKTATVFILVITLVVTITSNIGTIIILCFIIRHRRHRIFVASGQRLNYVVIAGAFMAFITIYIFVLFESSLGPKMPKNLFTFFCIVRLYMIMMSFTFTFGTLFVRAWRIYRIFNNPFVAKRKYTDTYLLLIVGFLALIDVVLVTVFISVDSYGGKTSRLDANYDSFTSCTYLGCFGENFFLIGTFILAVYKILQMLLFLFVVSLVRRGVIERKIYDDSKFLAIALYASAVFFFIGLPLQVLLQVSFRIAEALAVNMVWVIVSTDLTLFVIYVPKLYQIIYKKIDVRTLMTQKSKFYLYSVEPQGSIL